MLVDFSYYYTSVRNPMLFEPFTLTLAIALQQKFHCPVVGNMAGFLVK